MYGGARVEYRVNEMERKGKKKKERFESGTGWDYEIMFYER